jgi:hypothetical protein
MCLFFTGRQYYRCSQQPNCDFFKWADEQSGPPCRCNIPSVKRTVKNGANQGLMYLLLVWTHTPIILIGREFFSCTKHEGCGFFEWVNGAQTTASSTPHTMAPAQSSSGASIVCGCNIPAAQRTVVKDGPNKGCI